MTRRTTCLCALAAVLLAVAACGRATQPAADRPRAPPPRAAGTLYHRLGGYDAIAAVVDDFLARMLADRELAVFFENLNDAAKQRVRQMIVDQLCAASGGPCIYVGQDMRTAHQGMGITEADWNRAVGHLMVTLDRFRVPQREKDELLAAISALKDQIVEQ